MSTFLSFLQFEHRKVAIEKVREQYTDDAEKKSKFFWSCLAKGRDWLLMYCCTEHEQEIMGGK